MASQTGNASRSLALDISTIASISNPADVAKFLNEAIHEERAVDVQLEELLKRRETFEELLRKSVKETEDVVAPGLSQGLPIFAQVLEVVQADGEQLLSCIQNASEVAEGISFTVKALDTTQSNVRAALDYIKLLTDRGSCVHRLRENMEHRRYDLAAECVTQFRELENQLTQPPEPHQRQAVDEFEVMLLDIIRDQLAKAMERDDMDEILRFLRLFLPLDRKAEGCQMFGQYLKTLVARAGHEAYQKLSTALESRSAASPFVERLSDVFRFVAVTVEQQHEYFVECFGVVAMLDVILELYAECDQCGSRILKRFSEARNIEQMVRDLNLFKKKDLGQFLPRLVNLSEAPLAEGSGSSPAIPVDPRHAETLLLEILGLIGRCDEFNELMTNKMTDISHPQPLTPPTIALVRESQISFLGRELSGKYVTLEEFYMEESIRKAILIDKAISGSLVTSMVDDVFFICRKSATRAISSRSVPCLCAVISLMHVLLTTDFFTAVQKPRGNGPAALIQSVLSEKAAEETGEQYSLFLNNLQVSLTYVTKLKSELEQRVANTFQISNEREIASSLLDDMEVLVLNLERLLSAKLSGVGDVLMTKLMPFFQEMVSMEYLLNEQLYEQLSETETWSHRILTSTRQFSEALEPLLTSELHSQIFDRLLQSLVARCEAQFMQKSFNQLGGLQFDRDIRLMVSHFSEIYQSSVREKFARLTQMATILCFESVEEMLDYWGEEGESIKWRLSPAEIKSILKRRQDFSEANISALLL